MRSFLSGVLQLVMLWAAVSVVAGWLLSRIGRSIDERLHGRDVPPRPIRSINDRRVGCMSRSTSVDYADDAEDAVEATGDVIEEGTSCSRGERGEKAPAAFHFRDPEDWTDTALDRLWAAIHDGEAFDVEMAVYELRSEIDLVGVAGFTHRWWWKHEGREKPPADRSRKDRQ